MRVAHRASESLSLVLRITGLREQAMPINAAWHRAHPMPKNPTQDERIAWHVDHAERCGCRPIPESLRREIERRARKRR
jgi:hypothetical protein